MTVLSVASIIIIQNNPNRTAISISFINHEHLKIKDIALKFLNATVLPLALCVIYFC